ncbi:PadR family transcriptional regulator [Agreia bicolorata]|uniref:Regulatory protein n=1 Tax=Agreia bicolorata TaxID=110935 RepID=A0ABR5CG46_9MICO|nr:PadR family transcriptional regulator [Agreia bicolorata]KJC64576.1 regulatory protein [Agreia bicolorata]
MSLRFALLAVLTAQPMTGYDLAQAFRSSVGHVWHAPNSQIYPELRRMEQEGLIRGESVAWGSRGTKTRYEVVDEGIVALRAWLAAPMNYSRERDPAHLRAAYFEWADAESARRNLREHRRHFEELLGQWQEQLNLIRSREHPIVKQRLAIYPESDWPRITAYKEFAYEGLVAQAEQEIAWATRGLALVDRLERQPSPPADS